VTEAKQALVWPRTGPPGVLPNPCAPGGLAMRASGVLIFTL